MLAEMPPRGVMPNTTLGRAPEALHWEWGAWRLNSADVTPQHHSLCLASWKADASAQCLSRT